MSPPLEIAPEDPRGPEAMALLGRHLTLMHASSPACDVHALDVDGLCVPEITFIGVRREGVLVAVGALKRLSDFHAELKSMHTQAEHRGEGVGTTLVEYLLDLAHSSGVQRVSLETGSQDAFVPARRLYARHGFAECGPFGDYAPSTASTFMTLALQRDD